MRYREHSLVNVLLGNPMIQAKHKSLWFFQTEAHKNSVYVLLMLRRLRFQITNIYSIYNIDYDFSNKVWSEINLKLTLFTGQFSKKNAQKAIFFCYFASQVQFESLMQWCEKTCK